MYILNTFCFIGLVENDFIFALLNDYFILLEYYTHVSSDIMLNHEMVTGLKD